MAPNPLLMDPTRTTTLVKRFLADIAARYRRVGQQVQAAVVGGNIFGLDTPVPKIHRVVANTKFAFLSDPEKQQAGQKWMQEQVAAGILGVDADGKPVDGQPWTQPYIRSAYTAGIVRAYTDAHPELGQDSKFYQGSKAQFLNDAFNSPKSTKQIDLLGQRAFTYLKGIGPEADKQISQILAAGFAHGTSATKLGRELADALGMSRTRAERIARTEIIHAHAEAQLDAFELLGVKEVGVMAEWSTAGDGKVCPLCSPLQGVILTVDEARGMIPRHPNCRCAWLPANVGEATKGQKWNHENVGWAIDASVKAETGLDKPKAARDASRWVGADLKPSNKADLKPTKENKQKQEAEWAAQKAKAKAELEAARAAAKAKALAEKAAAEAAAQAAKEAAELAAKSEALVQGAMDAWPTFATGPNLPLDVLAEVDFGDLYGWPPSHKKHSYGVILFDDQGRILLRKSKGNYGGAGWTFSKGGEEAGMGAAGTAIKEGLEETGYKAVLVDALPDTYKGTTTKTNYFLGYADGLFPDSMDAETEAIQWMTYAEARAAIKATSDAKVALRDLAVLEDAYQHMKAGQFNVLADAVAAKAQEIAAAKAAQAAAEAAAKAAAEAAELAAKKAAAAAVQSHKVKLGMAQAHYTKKLGVLPEDWLAGGVPKLGKTGLDKVLAPKNWTLDLLDVDTQAKLLGAQDVVEQKAIVDALKKGKKALPPPAPQYISPGTGLPYPTHITPESNGLPTMGTQGLLQLMKDHGVTVDDLDDVLAPAWQADFWHKPVAKQVELMKEWASKALAAKAADETPMSSLGTVLQWEQGSNGPTLPWKSFMQAAVDEGLPADVVELEALLGEGVLDDLHGQHWKYQIRTLQKAAAKAKAPPPGPAPAAVDDEALEYLQQVKATLGLDVSDETLTALASLPDAPPETALTFAKILTAKDGTTYHTIGGGVTLSHGAKVKLLKDAAGYDLDPADIPDAVWDTLSKLKGGAEHKALYLKAYVPMHPQIKVGLPVDTAVDIAKKAADTQLLAVKAGKATQSVLDATPSPAAAVQVDQEAVDLLKTTATQKGLDVPEDALQKLAAMPTPSEKMTLASIVSEGPDGYPHKTTSTGTLKLSSIKHALAKGSGSEYVSLGEVPDAVLDAVPVSKGTAPQVLYWEEYGKLHQQVLAGTLAPEDAAAMATEAADIKHLGVLAGKVPAKGGWWSPNVPAPAQAATAAKPAPGTLGGVWDNAADVPASKLKVSGLLKTSAIGDIIPSHVLNPLGDEFIDAIDYAPDLQSQLNAIKKALARAEKAAQAAVVVAPTPAKAATAAKALVSPPIDLPRPANLKKLRDLPGSTHPSLMEDPTTGLRWVMKDKVDPKHMRSEALADELYRRAGVLVPRGGIVETAEGPVKFTEFLEGGETLQQWLQGGRTASEKAAMFKQVQRHFVADALLANHDVAGLSMDNLFVVKGKVYRIDNGGALTYRAQGGAKRTWGSVVQEMQSLRDESTNAQTAAVFKGITDGEIHEQIQELLTHKAAMLAAVDDRGLRDTLAARFDYLEGLLPKGRRTGATVGKSVPVMDLNEEAARRVVAGKSNGVAYAGDGDLVEDMSVLLWRDRRMDGKPTTKMVFKVTDKGHRVLSDALRGSMPADALTSSTVNALPSDTYWPSIQAALKTVNVHAKDGAYNQGTIATMRATKSKMQAALATAKGHDKAMLEQYLAVVDQLEEAMSKQATTPMFAQYVPPPPKSATKSVQPQYRVSVSKEVKWDVKQYKNGEVAKVLPQAVDVHLGSTKQVTVDLGDGMELRYVPRHGGNNGRSGYAVEGTVELLLDGEPSPEVLQRGRAALSALGVDLAPTDPAYEELVYLHKGVYLNKRHTEMWYTNIWDNNTLSYEEKLKRLKQAIRQNTAWDVPDKVGPNYNPAGTLINPDGSGWRKWYRWDIPPDKMEKQLDGYVLQHTTGSLSDSPPKAVPAAIEAMLESGGEAASTIRRYSKGIGVSGASSSSDINTGGANYFFTRIRGPNADAHGIFFKIRELARQDAISYGGDNFGAIANIGDRATDVATYKSYAGRGSNETIFKHGLSLINDVEYIRVHSESERQAVIAAYQKHGHTKLPDGRRVDDIVVVGSKPYKRSK